MNSDERENSHGGAGDAARELDPDEERTAVILPRLDRDSVARGLRHLATAFGRIRGDLFNGADFVDEGTAIGYPTLTEAEAEDIDALLEGAEHHVSGVRRVLKRAIGKQPTEDPALKEIP